MFEKTPKVLFLVYLEVGAKWHSRILVYLDARTSFIASGNRHLPRVLTHPPDDAKEL
jgi:hypothetical protein